MANMKVLGVSCHHREHIQTILLATVTALEIKVFRAPFILDSEELLDFCQVLLLIFFLHALYLLHSCPEIKQVVLFDDHHGS